MRSNAWLGLVLIAAAGGCGSKMPDPGPPPATVTFHLHNDGSQIFYLFENCILDYTITSLADPVHAIMRVDGCACTCGVSGCSVCGACAHTAIEVPVSTTRDDLWVAVDFTTESTPTGGCIRQQTLPPGPYRIDVPVYPTADDALAGTYARTATQSFTLPVDGNAVEVALGVSP